MILLHISCSVTCIFLCLFVKIQVASQNVVNAKETNLKGCKLSLDESSEQPSELMALIDDEELELEELQVGPNPLRCTAHLASNGRHGCPLCKGSFSSLSYS